MTWKHWIVTLVTGLAVASSAPAAVAETSAPEREGLKEVLRDVEIEMAAISEHAAKLERMVEWPNLYTMSAYEFEWLGIENRFNTVGKLIPELQKAPGASEGWKKEVIDEMAALIKAMGAQVESGFAYLDKVDTVERLYAQDLYELRIESIIHYADHIDYLIEYVESRANRTARPTS